MITISRQTARRTLMPSLAKVFRRVRSARTCLTRTARVNAHQLSTSVCSFIGEFGNERRPSGIINTLGEHSTSQAFDIQIFNYNQTIFVDHPTRNLMVKVRALVSDVGVYSLKQLYRFPARVRTFLSPRYFALCFAESLLRFAVVAWIVNFRSVAQVANVASPTSTPTLSMQTGKGCASTQAEKHAYQRPASRLIVRVLTLPSTARCTLILTLPIFERINLEP